MSVSLAHRIHRRQQRVGSVMRCPTSPVPTSARFSFRFARDAAVFLPTGAAGSFSSNPQQLNPRYGGCCNVREVKAREQSPLCDFCGKPPLKHPLGSGQRSDRVAEVEQIGKLLLRRNSRDHNPSFLDLEFHHIAALRSQPHQRPLCTAVATDTSLEFSIFDVC